MQGLICFWNGAIADIPAGWALCDGTQGTPDLRDRFVVGAKQDDGGVPKSNITGSLLQTGGSVDHTHTAVAGTDFWLAPGANVSTEQHIGPFYALALIMKLP